MTHLKSDFARFLQSDPDRLHFAAHSHHPWPDVSYEAHRQAWVDAGDLMDDKWEYIFGTIVPRTTQQIASHLGLAREDTITFAPSTHEFVVRLFSCFEPPIRILTTDAEFHSFSRQARRWEEEGLATVDRVPAEPFDTFADRFTEVAKDGEHDFIYLSHVFYDSGFVVAEMEEIVSSVPNERAFFVIDGYHSFMAFPVDLSAIEGRVFYLAGGYKYAMSGEGVCFMHCPPGYGDRPVDTGWYAAFGYLEEGDQEKVPFQPDGSRFAGATFDPSGVYRMDAVLDWLASQGVGPRQIRDHVAGLQALFLENLEQRPGTLTPSDGIERGNFLTFESDDARYYYRTLRDRSVVTDHRGNRLRLGFGIYHSEYDVERLLEIVNDVNPPS